MKYLSESTTTGSVATYNKPVKDPIKRTNNTNTCNCELIKKLQGKVICGICGKRH